MGDLVTDVDSDVGGRIYIPPPILKSGNTVRTIEWHGSLGMFLVALVPCVKKS